MDRKKTFKYIFIVAVFALAGLALADAVGVFNSKPYKAVAHGSHVHYVPNDRAPGTKIDDFPMEKPAPDETITPTGKVVKKQ